jgi:HD-GYP domain-containing protein (c-di-GMP phosphodiesterase class II)
LGARIIAVADAFDAMTSDRIYRPAMSVDAALQELRKGQGSQFDPQIVALFESACASGAVRPNEPIVIEPQPASRERRPLRGRRRFVPRLLAR